MSDIEERRTGSGDLDRKMVAFDPNIVGKNESFRYTKVSIHVQVSDCVGVNVHL